MLLGVRNASERLKALVGDVWVQTETWVRDVSLRGVFSLVQTCCCAGRFISTLQTLCTADDEFPITSQLKFLSLGFGSVVAPSVNCYFGKFD